MFGRQDYRSRDEARNNRLVAVLVFGEGWHNNHHAFPASARHGLDRGQFDVSWWVIRGLERLGLVWNVQVPDAAQRDAPPASERLELSSDRCAHAFARGSGTGRPQCARSATPCSAPGISS